MCSMDQSPRYHAFNIAKLSAECVNWEVFLRAHLDIMNDHFSRASDGSYAWAGRKTYIKELEVLEIDVNSLLIGICLRIQNPGQNHYFGNVGRVGRAMAETSDPGLLESTLLNLISDDTLDDYNRIVMCYLFLSYNNNLEDQTKKASNEALFKKTVHLLPSYIAEKVSWK